MKSRIFKTFCLTIGLLLIAAMTFAFSTRQRNVWTELQTFNNGIKAQITRSLPGIGAGMAGWTVDGGNDIDDASAPNLTTVDNIPAIVWDSSAEITGIQKTFRLPPDYVPGTALVLYALISSDTAAGTTTGLDWSLWDNADDTAFDAAAIAQSSVMSTSTTLDASNDILTLTLDATGIAALIAGHFYTIEVFNATTHVSANLELKGLDGVYTANQ